MGKVDPSLCMQHFWPSRIFTQFVAEVPNKNFSAFHVWP